MPYLLLMVAVCWHALGVGTQGLRGRIVHSITGAGMVWGILTPPSGWVQIGTAVATVLTARSLGKEEGRAAAARAGVWLWQVADTGLRVLGRTVRWVLSPPVHEGPAVEQSPGVSRHRDTLGSRMASTPPAHLFEPEAWRRGTAQDTVVTPILAPVDTYADIIGSVLSGRLGFNDGWRRAEKNFGVSRSKYARDVREARTA